MGIADNIVGKAIQKTSKWDHSQAGKLMPTYRNCLLFIEEEALPVRYNEFASHVEYDGERLSEHIILQLKQRMTAKGIQPPVSIIEEAVTTVALSHRYHPVKSYLEGLVWDKVPRGRSFLAAYAGAPDDPYSQLVTSWLLLAPIYRVYHPGCQYDTMVILEGDQGIGKSRIVRALGGPWYKAISLMDRDHNTIQLMQGAWIIEVPELSVFAKRDIESLKSFISNPVDFARFAYGRIDNAYPRQSIFVGTINPETNGYLMDPTGNRRFLPVKLGDIHVESIEAARDQLFAEAMTWYKNKVKIYTANDELTRLIATEQAKREFHDDWSTIILNYININRLDTSMQMTACEIYQKAIQGETKNYDQRVGRRIANIMRRLGCGEPFHTRLNGVDGKYFDVSRLIKNEPHTGNAGWETEK